MARIFSDIEQSKTEKEKIMSQLQWKMNTEIGPLFLVASERGLQKAFWDELPVPKATSLSGSDPATTILAQAVQQLEEYFAGQRKTFDIPFDVKGTEFQNRVWRALEKIPYGMTCSYSDIARKLHQEKAVRAVGTANGKNPVCIIVPCHRVIAANGSLGGYSGGLAIKEKLLKLEGTH
jgi:methylated-DNA-[protein]-cysteine S-methyltransferase